MTYKAHRISSTRFTAFYATYAEAKKKHPQDLIFNIYFTLNGSIPDHKEAVPATYDDIEEMANQRNHRGIILNHCP